MANYATLKAAIQQVVKTNGNNEITGALLQQSLLAMITSLGDGYQFVDVATPATTPGTPDQNVFYIGGPGTYSNMGGTVVNSGEIGIFRYNGSWSNKKLTVGKDYDNQLDKKVDKNPITNLVDKNDKDVKRGYYLDGNVLRQGSAYDTTGFVPVDGNTTYSDAFESGTMRFVSYYDENKNYISNTQNVTSFSTPQNCAYVRITYYASNWDYIALAKGAERKSYEEYNPISGYLPVPAERMLIKLTGFGNYGPSAGVTQNGDCFYDTNLKQIRQATNLASNRYRVIPFYPGAIYTYNGNFYIWNGTDLVKAPADVLSLQQTVATLSGNVTELANEVANIGYTIDPILENPMRGVSFGTSTPQAVRDAITKIWIESTEPTNVDKVIANAPKLYLRYISNVAGSYRPLITICDVATGSPTDAPAFSWFLNSQSEPRTVKEIISLICRSPYNEDWDLGVARANIKIEIDWSKISGTFNTLAIEIDTASLQRYNVDKVSLSAVKSSVVQNSLYGKTVVCFGDSITELADTSGLRYSDYLQNFSNANVINVGIGGSQLRQRLEPVTNPTSNGEAYAALDVVSMVTAAVEQDFTKQINAAAYLRDHASDDNTAIVARLQSIDWSKVDVVTFFAGTNDWYGGLNYGESGSLDKTKTLGAINWIIQNLLTTYPHVKIFWFLPIVRWVDYSGGTGTAANFGDTYKPGTYTLKEFAALIQNEVGLSHIPVCDLYNTLGWNMWNFSNYFPNNDGTHPRKPAGMLGIAARMFGFLISHKNY